MTKKTGYEKGKQRASPRFFYRSFLPLLLFCLCTLPGNSVAETGLVKFSRQNNNSFSLTFNVDGYRLLEVVKDGITYSTIEFAAVKTGKKGWPELPFLHSAIQVPFTGNADIEIIDASFEDFQLSRPLLPSRGVIYRSQPLDSIPYSISRQSLTNSWYPDHLFTTSRPYILRKVRGQNIFVYPFQYNGQHQTLRVYSRLTLRINNDKNSSSTPLTADKSRISREMAPVYDALFVNYQQTETQSFNDYGEILVLYTARDSAAIQPWIIWKKKKGFKVHQLEVSPGTNAKAVIQKQYDSNNNILYVLLVGDYEDIASDLGTDQQAPMDPMLGCVAGADEYYDLIIGRFSAGNAAEVSNQVEKTIRYEREPDPDGTWYARGLGIGSGEGEDRGDDGEADYIHIDIIKKNKLLASTYTTVAEAYKYPDTSLVTESIDSGVGLINYCGHGTRDGWGTSGYTNEDIRAAVNGDKLPFIFSVSCANGEFHTGDDCFAETWLKKKNGGAVAAWMATIDQPWQSPMRGQDYANDLLIQGYDYAINPGNGISTDHGRTTFGALTFQAATLMLSESSLKADWETYKTWTIFGDPSLQIRTAPPKVISLSYNMITPGIFSTMVTTGGIPVSNGLVALYSENAAQPFSAITDQTGKATVTHSLGGPVTLTVTGPNLATFQQTMILEPAPLQKTSILTLLPTILSHRRESTIVRP